MPAAGTGAPGRAGGGGFELGALSLPQGGPSPAQPRAAHKGVPSTHHTSAPHPGHPVVTLTPCHCPGVSPRLCRDPTTGSRSQCLIQSREEAAAPPNSPKIPWDLRASRTPQEEQPGRAGPPQLQRAGTPQNLPVIPHHGSSPAPAAPGRICVSPPHSGVPSFVPSEVARPSPPMLGVCDPSPMPGQLPPLGREPLGGSAPRESSARTPQRAAGHPQAGGATGDPPETEHPGIAGDTPEGTSLPWRGITERP